MRRSRSWGRRIIWRPTGAIVNAPAVLIVALLTWICYIGVQQSTRVNNVMVVIKIADHHPVHRGRHQVRHARPLAARTCRRIPAPRDSSAGAASCRAPRSSSSPTSASTRPRRRRRKRATRSATCRSGIIAALLISTVLYVLMSAVMTGMVSYTRAQRRRAGRGRARRASGTEAGSACRSRSAPSWA